MSFLRGGWRHLCNLSLLPPWRWISKKWKEVMMQLQVVCTNNPTNNARLKRSEKSPKLRLYLISKRRLSAEFGTQKWKKKCMVKTYSILHLTVVGWEEKEKEWESPVRLSCLLLGTAGSWIWFLEKVDIVHMCDDINFLQKMLCK